MNVGFVVDHWGVGGGTSGQCHLAARALGAGGHRITVYAPTSSSPEVSGVTWVRVPPRRGWGPGAWAAGVREAVQGKHDVLMSWVRAPGAPVWRAGGGTHRAFLEATGRSGWRGSLRPQDRGQLAADAACQGADVVVANSASTVNDLVQGGVDAECVHLVRNGVDLERFRPGDGSAGDGRVALFLGHGFRRKGLDVAAKAFERVGGAHDRLWVAGHDAHAGRWRRRVHKRLGDRLRWIGPVANVEELLRDVDVVLHPTRYDSSANVVLEALASGVPAVTTRADGAHEVVPSPELVVDNAEDVDGVARALGYAWEVRQPQRWRQAAEAWPGSRMARGLETLLTEWLDARNR